MPYYFDFMYCIICEQMCHVDIDGLHIITMFRPYEHTHKDVCYGPFTWYAHPEFSDDWELVVEPDEEFVAISNANVESLLLEFQE